MAKERARPRRRKVLELDEGLLRALEELARDRRTDLGALVDEAVRDLLKKHRRPATLLEALRESTRDEPANDRGARASRRTS